MGKKRRQWQRPIQNQLSPSKPGVPITDTISNSLTDATQAFGFNGLSSVGLGAPGSSNFGSQLSQIDTLFRNNRWYLISNMRQILSELYMEHGLVQTIVNVPVDDALRGGLDIVTKQLEPDEIEKLVVSMEREEDMLHYGQGQKWTRLFGGGGVIIITDQDFEKPLDVSSIDESTNLSFRPVDLWELFYDRQNVDDLSNEDPLHHAEFFNYYGKKLHKSRVIQMKGMAAPSFIRPRLRGWGFSVMEAFVRSINQFLKATDLTFSVLDEFKVDYYKIYNLNNSLMAPDGGAKMRKRLALANQQKNYDNAVVMDAQDSFEQKELSFTGLAEVMAGIRMQIASDLRFPLTKLFGISAAGFSSGEDDIENYNAMIESSIRAKAKYDIIRMIELRCQQIFGFVPDDLQIHFKPLRVMSSEQEENVKTQKYTRALQARQAGEITKVEFRDICNKDNLLSIKLDNDEATLQQVEEDHPAIAVAAAAPKQLTAPKSTDEAPEAKE
jgi:phage-related protein (TIGR01555 family)